MNSRIVRGLLFEHATRTWPFMVAALLVLLLYAPLWVFDTQAVRSEIEPMAHLITLFVVAIGLLYSAAEGERMTSEFPQRTLLLPVSTLTIVAVKFAWSIAVIGALSLIVHGVMALVYIGPSDPWYYYFTSAVIIFATLQTIALASGCLGDWSLGILFGAYMALLTYIVEFVDDFGLLRAPLTAFLLVLGLLAVCLTLSSGVVHLRRAGRWDPALLWPARARSRTGTSEDTLAPFDSAFAAQRWIETSRMQRYFWITFGFCILALATFDAFPSVGFDNSGSSFRPSQRLVLGLSQIGVKLSSAFALAALVTGIVMAFQNHRIQMGPMSAFLYLRPMTSAELARARLSGTMRGMRVILLSIALFVIVAGAAALLIDRQGDSTLIYDQGGAFVHAQVAILLLTAGAAWALYWTVNVCAALLLYTVFAVIVDWLDHADVIPTEASAYPVGWVIAMTLMVGLIAAALIRGQLSPRSAGIAAVAVCVFTVAYRFLISWATPGPNSYPDLILLALFLLLPVATTPLTLHWARHR